MVYLLVQVVHVVIVHQIPKIQKAVPSTMIGSVMEVSSLLKRSNICKIFELFKRILSTS